MSMERFTNVQKFPNKETLFEEEITAIMRILDEALDMFDERPNKGTIILDGQRKGEPAQCIMKMNLANGAYRRKFFGLNDLQSDEMAAESINAILNWPTEAAYGIEAQNLQFGELPSGCYLDAYEKVLVLNTTFGRFIISAQLAREDYKDGGKIKLVDYYDESVVVMKALAVALTKMGKEDKILRRSVKKIFVNATPGEKYVREEVENLLHFCSLPELEAWKIWHEKATDDGLMLYFE